MPKKGTKDSSSPTRSRSKSADRQSPSRRTPERSGRSRSRSQSRSRSGSRSRSSSRSRKEKSNGEVLKKETKQKSASEKSVSETKIVAKEGSKVKAKKEEKKSVSKEKTKKQEEEEEEEVQEKSPKKDSTKEKKSEKKTSIGRQSTPPRPRAARDLESPTRSSLRIREKQHAAETFDKKEDKERSSTRTGKEIAVPRTKEYAFGGPIGATFLIFSLPFATYFLNFVLENEDRAFLKPRTWFKGITLSSCFDQKSALIFLGWFLFHTVIAIIPFGGKKGQGLPLRGSGKRLSYNCNGFFALIFSLLLLGFFAFWDIRYRHGKLIWFTYVVDNYFPFMMFAMLFSVLLSILLYVKSRTAPAHALAPDGNSGVFVYDFFMGHELNPRISSFDLKFFCEFRPGLIGWVFLDIGFCVKYWQLYGQWNPAMILITIFHLLYVGDALFFEEAILTTMDITHEGFGFMLAFGDLVWVPFTYTLTTHYLLLRGAESTPIIALIGAGLLCLVGYWIFRASNLQKDLFRRDPQHPAVAGLTAIGTSSGRRLLAGGWWGLVRHPNYLGDIIMSMAWSVPCGVRSILPWFYPVYLTGLLVSRELRDERACAKKHGHGWQKYIEAVPYRIVPRVF